MLPLCCLCPCGLCSGFQPVAPLWLRAHTRFVPEAPLQEHRVLWHSVPQKDKEKGLFGTVCLFAHPPHPTSLLPARLLKMVTHQLSDLKKIPVQLQLQRWTSMSTIFLYFMRGKGRSMSPANLSSDRKRHWKNIIDLQCHFISQTKMWYNKYLLSSSFTEAVFHFDWWF